MGAKEDREAWTKKVTRDEMAASVKRSKYNAQKTDIHGKRFDSAKEAKRYLELAMLQAAKQISYLRLQVPFKMFVNDIHVGTYLADFVYLDAAGKEVIEDVKSKATATPVYRLKKRIIEALYSVTITEI
jgi:hypothetical protein